MRDDEKARRREREWTRPTPVEGASWSLAEQVVTAIVAGGVLFTLLGGLLVPTMGGRRSTRLKWEARRQEIRDAVAGQASESPAPR
jgi:hypothetical protein